jgi:hypothetical protein
MGNPYSSIPVHGQEEGGRKEEGGKREESMTVVDAHLEITRITSGHTLLVEFDHSIYLYKEAVKYN